MAPSSFFVWCRTVRQVFLPLWRGLKIHILTARVAPHVRVTWMRKSFVVSSGAGIRDTREWVPSATEALRLVRAHMRLRRPAVRIEDERGDPVSLFRLKETADLETKKRTTPKLRSYC